MGARSKGVSGVKLTYALLKALDSIACVGAANMTGHVDPGLVGRGVCSRLSGFGLVEFYHPPQAVYGERVRLTAFGKESLRANGYRVPEVATFR